MDKNWKQETEWIAIRTRIVAAMADNTKKISKNLSPPWTQPASNYYNLYIAPLSLTKTFMLMKLINSVLIFLVISFGGCASSFQQENEQGRKSQMVLNREAEKYFEKAIGLQRDNGFFLSTKEDTLILLEAAGLIEKAIKLDSLNQNFYYNLSQLHFRLGNNNRAIQILDKYLVVDPENEEAITAQGFLFEKMGNLRKASNRYRTALELYDEKTYGARINKAFLILLLHGVDQAMLELKEIEEEFPEQDLSAFEYQFKNFNREQFINNSLD